MVNRLKELEMHVIHRIYLSQMFKWPKNDMIDCLKNFLTKGTKFNDVSSSHVKNLVFQDDLVQLNRRSWYEIARKRMDRLVRHCEKCRLFDFTNQFYQNGKLQYYDPKYYVSYFVRSLHLSPIGLHRYIIRCVIICK